MRIFNRNLHIMFGFSRGGAVTVYVAAVAAAEVLPSLRAVVWAMRTRKDDGAQQAWIYGRVFDFVIKLRFKCVAAYIYVYGQSRETVK